MMIWKLDPGENGKPKRRDANVLGLVLMYNVHQLFGRRSYLREILRHPRSNSADCFGLPVVAA